MCIIFWKIFFSLFQLINPETVDNEKENVATEVTKYIAPVTLARGLMSITSVDKADPKDAETIAMATVRSAHHPSIGKAFKITRWAVANTESLRFEKS